jgi:hypothetical protein
MPYPNKKIDENVFLDPTTEKVADGWNVFKKMKDAINNIIGARGEVNGIPSLGADSKIPIEQIPDKAVNPNLDTRFNKIINHNHGSTSPPAPKLGQIWHDSEDSVLKVYGDDGWQPLGGRYISLVTGDIIRTSRSISLKKGTYYLMPVGGDGSAGYWNGLLGIRFLTTPGNAGTNTTIEIDGFTSTGVGGSAGSWSKGKNVDFDDIINPEVKPGRPASETGLFGLGGGGYVPLTDIKVISETKTAVIELGVGGEQATSSTTAGKPGWCVIWKIN